MAKRAVKKKVQLRPQARYTLLAMIVLLGLFVLYVAKSYILAAVTAAIFVIATYPLYTFFLKKCKEKKGIAAVITLLILTVLVLAPSIILISLVANSTLDFLTTFSVQDTMQSVGEAKDFVSSFIHFEITDLEFEQFLQKSLSQARSLLVNSSLDILNGVTYAAFQIIFILVFMFYFYVHGPKLYKYVQVLLPFSHDGKKLLQKEITGDIRALLVGQGLVAVIQGVLSGIGYFIFGLPSVILWTFVTMIMAFIPFFGTGIVWIPAALYLLATGNTFAAIGLALWGAIIVSNIDGILRPILVNSMAKINFLTVLVGAFAGIATFGLIGIVLGPLLISVLIILIKIYIEEASGSI